jgi:hypothetical protein
MSTQNGPSDSGTSPPVPARLSHWDHSSHRKWTTSSDDVLGESECVHEWRPSSLQRESPAPNPSHRPRGLAPRSPSVDRDAPPSRRIDGPVAREPLLEHTGSPQSPPLTESTQSRLTAQKRERNREAERLLDRCETTESAIANARRAAQSAAFSHHANHSCDDWLTRRGRLHTTIRPAVSSPEIQSTCRLPSK